MGANERKHTMKKEKEEPLKTLGSMILELTWMLFKIALPASQQTVNQFVFPNRVKCPPQFNNSYSC
jgi:hypothetical protein